MLTVLQRVIRSPELVVPFTLFFVLSVIGHGVRSVDWFTAIPGNLGDPRLNSVFLEHVYGWVMGRTPSLWSPQFFYPFENVFAFSDNHLGSAPTYIILRLLDFSREGAMAGWIVVGCALNFIASYWALRKLSFSGFAAAAAAFVFSSALPVLGEPSHAQLIYRFATPLCFYYFWIAIQEGEPSKLGIAALWFAEQFYCSIYLGVFLSYLLLATFIATLLINPKRFFSLLWLNWQAEHPLKKKLAIAALIVGSGLTITLLWKYKIVSKGYDLSWPLWLIDNHLPRIRTYFGPTDFFLGYGLLSILGIGLLLFGLSSINFRTSKVTRNPLEKVMWITIAILFGLTFKFGDYSFYHVLLKIPGIASMRGVYRLIFVLIWPLAILVAFTLQELFAFIHKDARKTRYCCLALVTLILCLETLLSAKLQERTSYIQWRSRIDRVRNLVPDSVSKNSILFVHNQIHEENALTELDGMILAQEINRPTLNGFSGHEPPGFDQANLCFSYRDRIKAYQRYTNQSDSDIDSFTARLLHINANHLSNKPFSYETAINVPIQESYPNPRMLIPNPLYCGWPPMPSWETWSNGLTAGILLPLPITGKTQTLELEISTRISTSKPNQSINIWIDNQLQKTMTLHQSSHNQIAIEMPTSSQKKGWVFVEITPSESNSNTLVGKNHESGDNAIKIEKLLFLP